MFQGKLFFLLVFVSPFIGSFIGMLSYRLPRSRPFIVGRSRCDACNRTLSIRDLIPILSYVLLQGKCRTCKSRAAFPQLLAMAYRRPNTPYALIGSNTAPAAGGRPSVSRRHACAGGWIIEGNRGQCTSSRIHRHRKQKDRDRAHGTEDPRHRNRKRQSRVPIHIP